MQSLILSAILIPLTSAQILSYGGQNIGNFNSNIQRPISLPSSGVLLQNNAIPGITSTGTNGFSTINTNLLNRNLPIAGNSVANVGTTFTSIGNLASSSLLGNNLGGNIVSSNFNKGIVGNVNLPVNLANGFNVNTGSFALNNNNLAALLGNRPCGIQIMADALEVGGAVGVNGQLPFYTTVAVNGQLPTSGMGVVGCACGGQ